MDDKAETQKLTNIIGWSPNCKVCGKPMLFYWEFPPSTSMRAICCNTVYTKLKTGKIIAYSNGEKVEYEG